MGNGLQRVAKQMGGLVVTDGAATVVCKPNATGQWVGRPASIGDEIRRRAERNKPQRKKVIKDPEQKQRERWRRWLGAVCREDKDTWVELLASNWSGWPRRVLGEALPLFNALASTQELTKAIWAKAIEQATPEQFDKLDGLFCSDMMEKRFGNQRKRRR